MIRDLHLPFTCSLFRFELVVLNRSDLFDVIKLPRFADLGENKRSISDSDRVRPSQVVFESRKPVAVVCRPGKKKRDLSDDPFWPTSWISLPQKIYSYLYPWEEGPEELVFIADECQEFLVKMFLVTRSRIFISFPSKS